MPKKIVKTVLDKDGDIIKVKFEGNKTFTKSETAIRMIENGTEIIGVHIVHNQNGVQEKEKWLRTVKNNKKEDNLDEMGK